MSMCHNPVDSPVGRHKYQPCWVPASSNCWLTQTLGPLGPCSQRHWDLALGISVGCQQPQDAASPIRRLATGALRSSGGSYLLVTHQLIQQVETSPVSTDLSSVLSVYGGYMQTTFIHYPNKLRFIIRLPYLSIHQELLKQNEVPFTSEKEVCFFWVES